ncbi:hypothetical protein M405DRAFT_832773 [Rhizopogon salebrosus TDB-379]|nr:hypothetical protein M405DRAFT_832773 [Rhizopogon salebrosus TDB-379]
MTTPPIFYLSGVRPFHRQACNHGARNLTPTYPNFSFFYTACCPSLISLSASKSRECERIMMVAVNAGTVPE